VRDEEKRKRERFERERAIVHEACAEDQQNGDKRRHHPIKRQDADRAATQKRLGGAFGIVGGVGHHEAGDDEEEIDAHRALFRRQHVMNAGELAERVMEHHHAGGDAAQKLDRDEIRGSVVLHVTLRNAALLFPQASRVKAMHR
jgi:hypothetical protein